MSIVAATKSSIPHWLLNTHIIFSITALLATITLLVYRLAEPLIRSEPLYLYKTLLLVLNCYMIYFSITFSRTLTNICLFTGTNQFFITLNSLTYTSFILHSSISLIYPSYNQWTSARVAKCVCALNAGFSFFQTLAIFKCSNSSGCGRVLTCRFVELVRWSYVFSWIVLPSGVTVFGIIVVIAYRIKAKLDEGKTCLVFSITANALSAALSLIAYISAHNFPARQSTIQEVFNIAQMTRFWLYPIIVSSELWLFDK